MSEIKCDLCNRVVQPEEGGWTYLTPNVEEDPVLAEAKNIFWAEDQMWLVCNDCHPHVESGNLVELCVRWYEMNQTLATEAHIDYAFITLKAFMEHKTKRVWEDVVSPPGVSPPLESFS